MKKQLLCLVLIMLPMVASAHDIEVKNADGVTIYYNYKNNDTELEVTFHGGDKFAYRSNSNNRYTGNVVIPEEVTYLNINRKVTSIGGHAFYGCEDMTYVTIPSSVNSIGEGAFWLCTGLTSVSIPSSVASIGRDAFRYCTGLTSVHITDLEAWCKISFGGNPLSYANHLYLNGEEIKDLIIPSSVTSIGDNAFKNCFGLTSVTIPEGVTSIGDGAFNGCEWLTFVTIPSSITSIGWDAFVCCTRLTDVYCYSEKVPRLDLEDFRYSNIAKATLHVPASVIDKYMKTYPWNCFGTIVAIQ